MPALTEKDIDDSVRIVAQMGLEPYLKAMDEHPDFDIIIGGRAYDPAPYAAFCLHNGFTDIGEYRSCFSNHVRNDSCYDDTDYRLL